LKYLFAILSIIVILLLILLNKKISSKYQQTDVLKRTISKYYDSLAQSRGQRDSLVRIVDNLVISVETLSLELKDKDREIIKIKGKYNNLTQDSLGKLMDKRAWKGN
jgi:hypothetical protein